MNVKTIGKKLKAQILLSGKSYKEISKTSGVHINTVYKLIHEKAVDIQITTLDKICKALKLDIKKVIE